jgi:biopolymer transport protein ExbD
LDALVPQPNPNQNQPPPEDQDRTVVVSVNQGGQYMINQTSVTLDQLGPQLNEIFRTRAERIMFVRGDPEILFADVAQVIDIAKGVGIDKIGLITVKIEAGQ